MREYTYYPDFETSRGLMMPQNDYLDRRRLSQLHNEIRDVPDDSNAGDARG